MDIKKEMRKNTLMQIGAGFLLWFIIKPDIKKGTLIVHEPEPLQPDYVSQYFKDKEYFGANVIPLDYYNNWLQVAKQLDKIRVAFGSPIVIKKGFSIKEEKFNTCVAVEIAPQNNDHARLITVINFIKNQLDLKIIEQKTNKNIFIEV